MKDQFHVQYIHGVSKIFGDMINMMERAVRAEKLQNTTYAVYSVSERIRRDDI